MSAAAEIAASSGAQVLARIAALRESAPRGAGRDGGTYIPFVGATPRAGESGVYRILVPRRFGGMELSMGEFYRAVSEVARGCPSTGWCVCLAGLARPDGRPRFSASRYRPRYFAPEGDFRCPCRAPSARHRGRQRRRVGWTVKGRWDYCSGAPYATHFLAAVQPARGLRRHAGRWLRARAARASGPCRTTGVSFPA